MEVLAGCLLFFRRTTLLGSLLAMTIMTNIVAMNMAYDICVKLFSLNLLFLAVFLAAHDRLRLRDFFLRNALVAPVLPAPQANQKRRSIVQRPLKALFIFGTLYLTFWDSFQRRHERGDLAPKSPLYGIYTVQTFEKQGIALPRLTTDTVRWKRLISDRPQLVHVTTMADTAQWMKLRLDTVRKTLFFIPQRAPLDSFLLCYTRPDKDRLLLSGLIGADSVRISLTRFDLRKYKLVSRGFHWINENPYNR